MNVEKYGSGPESYFGIHGWGGDHRTFAPLAAHLPASAAIYSADLPGCGNSPAPRKWELPEITSQIVAAVSKIESTKITMIGNCSGAIFGLLAAEHLSERIARIVLIDPFAFLPWYFKIFVASSFGRIAYYSTFANPLGRRLTNLSLRNRRASKTNLTHSFSSVDHQASYQHLLMLSKIEGVERFSALTMPVDIVYGERTFNAVKQSLAHWKSVWPRARCYELAGAGHLPIEEATQQLCRIVFAPAEPEERSASALHFVI